MPMVCWNGNTCKFSSKLAVACIVDDLRVKALETISAKIDAAVPSFSTGTMSSSDSSVFVDEDDDDNEYE